MSPAEAGTVLAYVSAIDPRVRRGDGDETPLVRRAWATHLADITHADAIAAVDAHYAQPHAPMAMPGDISGRVHGQLLGQRREHGQRAGHEREAAALEHLDPDDSRAYLAALRAARGVPCPAPRARVLAGGADTPADALCAVWVRAWRATRTGVLLPSLSFAQHLGHDVTRLLGVEPDAVLRADIVTAAGTRAECPCGERAAHETGAR